MIESRYWRQELRRDVSWLKAHRTFRRWSERQHVLFERRLMLVAFQLRVLLERPKVAFRVATTKIKGRAFEKIGSGPVTALNLLAIDEHFDMDAPHDVRLSARDLCNQIIHHYLILVLRGERQRFESLLVFSDHSRNKRLYEFALEDLLVLFSLFASERAAPYDDGYLLQWDESRQDYRWVMGPADAPRPLLPN